MYFGSISGVAQCLSQAVDSRADAVLELDDGVLRPEFLSDLVPWDNFAWMLQEN